MSVEITQVDAFTQERFKGNPAAICILDRPGDEEWMQQVALEMNLSETAYVVPLDEGYSLRWFTPAVEVDLCGHATVAAAHVLWEKGIVADDVPCVFHTRSGVLTATLQSGKIAVDFPAGEFEPIETPDELENALGSKPVSVAKNSLGYLVLEFLSEQSIYDLNPNMSELKKLPFKGFVATAISEDESLDFVSRFFAPALGVDEDPVTGSAHCVLGPYWKSKLGKEEMNAYQASPRGGHVFVKVTDQLVTLSGHAITTMRGTLVGPN
jgi:PhzF family phenazine biosynthesis protein